MLSPSDRIGRELLYTLGGDGIATLGAFAVGSVVNQGCDGLGCLGGVVLGAMVGSGTALLATPAFTDLGGDRQGNYWAAVGGSALGLIGGFLAGGAVGNMTANSNKSLAPYTAVGTIIVIHTVTTVAFYELSVDDAIPERHVAAENGLQIRVSPTLLSDYQGATVQGVF